MNLRLLPQIQFSTHIGLRYDESCRYRSMECLLVRRKGFFVRRKLRYGNPNCYNHEFSYPGSQRPVTA